MRIFPTATQGLWRGEIAGVCEVLLRFLRYHDPKNWPLLREALKAMVRSDLIGNGKHHLIPTYQPMAGACASNSEEKFLSIPSMVMEKNQPKPGQILTQHTGLPPRQGTAGKKPSYRPAGKR